MLSSLIRSLWSYSKSSAARLITNVCRSNAALQVQQQRNVVLVRRLLPPPVPKLGKTGMKRKRRHNVYIFEEETRHRPKEKLKLILTEDVPKIGNRGEVVMVEKKIGRNKLIPAGSAVYASPENLKEFALARQKKEKESREEARLSPMALKTIEHLKKNKLEVRMHADSNWDTVTSNHVIHAFRHRLSVVVPEHALTMPTEPVTESGTYAISVTINGLETVPMEMEVLNHLPKRRGGTAPKGDSDEEAG